MNTKALRVKYNNEWPRTFNFPIEEEFLNMLKEENLLKAIEPCNLSFSSNMKFHNYLGYLIDSFDMLPKRPDLAFDNLWKALDDEFVVLKQEVGTNNCSRFELFVDHILQGANASFQYEDYLSIMPHQTSKYAAKRIIEASNESHKHDKDLFKYTKKCLGDNFVDKFLSKYPPDSNGKPLPANLRNAGRLLNLVFKGKEVNISGETFSFSSDILTKFLIKIVLANSRNERFHGKVFPPFRSSLATISTYSHAYYMLHISYAFLLDVFLYRQYGVVNTTDVVSNMKKNIDIFNCLFENLD